MIDLKIALAIAAFALAFGAGLKTCLWWNAGDLKDCESTVERVKEISNALAAKNEKDRLEAERITADAEKRFSTALDHARANPRIVRVREDCSGASGIPGLSATAQGTAGLHASGRESWITSNQCEQIANDSILDREWIETVKQLTDNLHEASK